MDSLFRRCLNASAIVHGAVVLSVVTSPLVLTAFRGAEPRKSPLQIYTVDVTASASPSPQPREESASPPAPPRAEERPIVKPRPAVKPVVSRTAVRQTPQTAQTARRTSERQTNANSSRSSRSRLSEEEIRRHLARGAVPGTETAIPGDEDICFERIRAALYTAWQQPSAEEAGGVVVEAEISLARDGRITGWRLVRRSGVAAMDRSIVEALQTVNRITGLSAAFLRSRETVTIEFRVGD
jgi:TonB family protein